VTSAPELQDPTLRLLAETHNYTQWLLDRCRPYVRGRVLDVGAGLGTFSELLADAADRLIVGEPDPAFYEHVRERFRGRNDVLVLNKLTAGLTSELVGGPVDVIVCFNVLEHIRDHGAALARFHELLAPGGHLLLLVPGHPTLFGAVDRAVEHERRYRKREVGVLLEHAELDVVELRRVNPVGAVGWLLWSRILRRDQLPARSTRMYDKLVPVLKVLDRLELPFGLSVWAVGRRR
jgi:SAM-dependent methyltransferase